MSAGSDFLQQMAAGSRERLERARRRTSAAALLDHALARPTPPPLRASPQRFDLIAELKLRSPAAGVLKSSAEDIGERVRAYAKAGAAAVSVLTEPSRFDGSMAHLEIAARALTATQVPAMRKDFIVDPYQVVEARLAGAGGVLVILRMLSPAECGALLECARGLGLFVLLEAFDEHDIELMHEIVAAHGAARHGEPAPVLLAGLNCRDLSSLQVVPARLEELAHLLPTTIPRVAESGVLTEDDAARAAAAGYQYMLVGSALMQHADPPALAAAMLSAGRAAVSPV